MKLNPYLWLAVGAVVFLIGVALAARRSTEHAHRADSAWNLRASQARSLERTGAKQ